MSSVPIPSMSSSSAPISSSSAPISETRLDSRSSGKIPSEIAEASFNTLTLRYTPENRVILEDKLHHLDDRDAKVNEVVTICETGKLDSNFLRENAFDLYALQAVREGKLSKNQFCSIMAVKAGLEEKDITPESFEEVPLFDNGCINERAWDILETTNQFKKGGFETYLNDYEFSNLFEAMEKEGIPPSEQKFYIIPDTRKDFTAPIASFGNEDYKISHALELEAKFTFLITCTIDGQKYRIIPSHTLRQMALNEHYKENALEMLPVISPSTLPDLRSAQMENKRDYAVPVSSAIPGSEYPTPLIADGYHASKLDFEDHDWYHAWTASAVPEKHRKVALELSRFFETHQGEFKYNDIFCGRLVDLEFMNYRKEIGKASTEGIKFWMELQNTIVFGLQIAVKTSEDFPEDANVRNFLESDFYNKFAKYIAENKLEWGKAHITLNELIATTDSINKNIEESLKLNGFYPYQFPPIIKNIQSEMLLFSLRNDLC